MDVLSSPCAGGIDDTIFEEADQPHDMISHKVGTSVSPLLTSRSRQDFVLRLPQPARTRHPVLLPSRVSERGPAEALLPGTCTSCFGRRELVPRSPQKRARRARSRACVSVGRGVGA